MIEYPLFADRPVPAGAAPEETIHRSTDLDDRALNRAVISISVPTVTVYPAGRDTHRGASIVICPGGGYEYLAIDRGGHALARYFQHRGLTSFVLKYRLPSGWLGPGQLPLSLQDALAALRFVRARSSIWGLNPRRIGILGTSAGGHLAGAAAIFGQADNETRPDFAVLLSPVVTLREPLAHRVSRERLLGLNPPADQVDAFSLEQRVREGLPPFFLAHARDDVVVDAANAELLADSLRQRGVPVELTLVPAGGHAFSSTNTGFGALWRERFIRWLDTLP